MKTIKKIFYKMWKWIQPYLTIKMLPIILPIYFFTNLIWYFFAFAPLAFPDWLTIFARSYLVFLYMPFSIEKPIIIAVSLFLYKLIYKEKFVHKEK